MNADIRREHGYTKEIVKGKKIEEEILQELLSPFKKVSFFKNMNT